MVVDVFFETWRALLAPRRLIPIVIVCAPLVGAEIAFTPNDLLYAALSVLMCVGFVLLAPALWRVLFPVGRVVPFAPIRLAGFGAAGALFVLALGVVVPRLFGLPVSFLTSLPSLVIVGAMFCVGGWGLGRDIDLEERLLEERARAELLEKEAERARLMALRSHLDPHFLFNTLNAIAEWCREDGEVAEQAVLQLSAMLRTILEGVRAPSWPLSLELELIDTLFSLHRIRDPGLFSLDRSVDGAVDEARVPPMVLLPLAENAVKHGPAAGHRGVVALRVLREGDRVRVEIENPGAFVGRRPGGEGLSMVEQRLSLAYNGDARFDISATDDARTRVVVEIPAAGPGEGALT